MIPFFGHGVEGKERGVRLALAAGIKESLYDEETLVSYLLFSLWRENPTSALASRSRIPVLSLSLTQLTAL